MECNSISKFGYAEDETLIFKEENVQDSDEKAGNTKILATVEQKICKNYTMGLKYT